MKNNKCRCEICKNNIREEMQFAAMKFDESFRIVSAGEIEHLDIMQEKGMIRAKNKQCNDFEEIEVDEKKESIYVYGVFIPQYSEEKTFDEWNELIKKSMGYAYLTLKDEKQYISIIEDFRLFNENMHYGHYPCVVKLKTDIDFNKKLDFGFGYVFSLKYQDILAIESCFNREFLFCLRDLKHTPGFDDIDKDQLEKNALELF